WRFRPRAWALALVTAVSGVIAGLAFAGPAAAIPYAGATAQAGKPRRSISPPNFVDHVDTEPYVGNGYFSQRVPAAGMGLLTGLGKIGWPLGSPRFTEGLAAGLYAHT